MEAEITGLVRDVAELREQLRESEQARKAQKKVFEQSKTVSEKAHDEALRFQKREMENLREQMRAEHLQLQKELEFEIQQSKQLQAAQPQGAHGQAVASSILNSSSNGHTANLQRQLDANHATIKLVLELVGMELLHRTTDSTNGSDAYSFLMSDTKRKRHLHFRLITHTNTESTERTIDFLPDFQRGRDDDVQRYLDESLRDPINFKWELLPIFFRRVS